MTCHPSADVVCATAGHTTASPAVIAAVVFGLVFAMAVLPALVMARLDSR
jgi:hypothetical protein